MTSVKGERQPRWGEARDGVDGRRARHEIADLPGRVQAHLAGVRDRLGWIAATVLLLDRRAAYRAERAENTAVTGLGTQHGSAVATFVEKLAGVRGHGFLPRETAVRADKHGLEHDGVHSGFTGAPTKDSPHRSWP